MIRFSTIYLILLFVGCSYRAETGVLKKATLNETQWYGTYDLEFEDGTKWNQLQNSWNFPLPIGKRVAITCNVYRNPTVITEIKKLDNDSIELAPKIQLDPKPISTGLPLFKVATKFGDIIITENEYNHSYLDNYDIKVGENNVIITRVKK